MKTFHTTLLRAILLGSAAVPMAVVAVQPAAAQVTTGSLDGTVLDNAGAPVADAAITVVSEGTAQVFTTTTDANGSYTLNTLRPAPYIVRVTVDGEAIERRVVIGIGSQATLDLYPETLAQGDIVVTGGRIVEVRTSEVGTNVSQNQIRRLPQTDRNFLSFAKLAPGVNYTDSETNKRVTSGASTASGVNVFIDGVSLKNQVLDGGVAGQQDSRGNPFGQLAVQEFRVLTQNFKAEYEQASAAVITAVTKSGTNEFHGEIFGQYTDRTLREKTYFEKRDGRSKSAFKRKQYGVSLGGPIIKDKLFFFGAYEGNDQDFAKTVTIGNRTPANIARFGQFEGDFVSPFRGDFFFGKLTLVPDNAGTFDLSYSKRTESDIQGFGGQSAYSAAENKLNDVDTLNLKWTYFGDDFTNEFSGTYSKYVYNPTALNPELPTQDYQGALVIGGKDSTQRISQTQLVFRNDTTYSGFDGHDIKWGIKYAVADYDFQKNLFPQPRYTYRIDDRGTASTADDLDFTFPFEARLGLGNPNIKANNNQFGIYVQDDWEVTDKLLLNFGLRWDWESNMFNNEYVTPAAAVATLRALPKTDYFDPEDYITDGTDRPTNKSMFQPRFGFSYDMKGDESTVIFGGYGRYYDRNVFNNTLDEQFRLQYTVGTFFFSRDGAPRDGNPTVIWNDSYSTREGLLALQATVQTGLPELFAVKNNAKAPVTDQFSLGVRQQFGEWSASITGSYIRGRNGYTHLFATRNAQGNCCDTTIPRANGYGNVLIGYDGLDTRYKALYFTLEKPYSETSGWGVSIAYTLGKAEQNGNDLFSLDKITPDDYGFRPRPGDERHKVVLSGMVDLPLGFRMSTFSQFGSGAAYQVFDATAGFGLDESVITSAYPEGNCIFDLFAFCEVNVSLENSIKMFDGHELNIGVDFLNVFNNTNFAGFDGFRSSSDPLEPGIIGNELITLPRRVQVRVGYRF